MDKNFCIVSDEELEKLIKASEYEYLKSAVKTVMKYGQITIAFLQRRLSIVYSRAIRIVKQMEEKGYIEPLTDEKQIKVLITPEQFKKDFGEDYNS